MALMTFDEYFKKYNGKGIDFDGQYSFQCFDLANDYCVKVLGGKAFVGMYAWEIYQKFSNQPSKDLFTRIANTPEFVPQKGDIIVWGQSLNGEAGHVAICDGVGDTTYFYSYEQNWDGMCHPTERVKHNYNHVLGVLRPKDQSKIKGTSNKTSTATSTTKTTTTTTTNGFSNSSLATKKNLFTTNYNERNQKITRITLHHMAGNLTIDGCKNALMSRGGSVNYAIQNDGTIGLLLPEKFRAWTSNSPDNDYKSVTVEIANVPNAGEPDWKVSDAAIQSAIKLCADICKRNGISKLTYTGKLEGSNLTMHKWFYATGCPGQYLGSKFPYIAEQVNKILSGSSSASTTTNSTTSNATVTPIMTYKTYYVNNASGVNYRETPNGTLRGTYKNGTAVRVASNSETKVGGYTWVRLDTGFYMAKEFLSTTKPTTQKSVTEIAKEVIAGKWGNGVDRVRKLSAAGYDANAVQRKVNELMKK